MRQVSWGNVKYANGDSFTERSIERIISEQTVWWGDTAYVMFGNTAQPSALTICFSCACVALHQYVWFSLMRAGDMIVWRASHCYSVYQTAPVAPRGSQETKCVNSWWTKEKPISAPISAVPAVFLLLFGNLQLFTPRPTSRIKLHCNTSLTSLTCSFKRKGMTGYWLYFSVFSFDFH